jgi:hypothetical protein
MVFSMKLKEVKVHEFAGRKIEKNEMGWACGAYGEGRGVHRVFGGEA